MEETWIFYTAEGTAAAPDGAECENLQILGIETGRDAEQALQTLLDAAPWIHAAGYREIRARRCGSAVRTFRT